MVKKDSRTGLSKSDNTLPLKRTRYQTAKSKINAENIINVMKNIQQCPVPPSESEGVFKLSNRVSTDSVIYIGTTYKGYHCRDVPIIDLTKSDSNMQEFQSEDVVSNSDNVLNGNTLQYGDSSQITRNTLSVITIRPPSARSLLSSASENTLYNDYYKTEADAGQYRNAAETFSSLTDISHSELKLHKSYPLSGQLEQSDVDLKPAKPEESALDIQQNLEILKIVHELHQDYEEEIPMTIDVSDINIRPIIEDPILNNLDISALNDYFNDGNSEEINFDEL